MADQRTMAELLCAPTEGYAEAIVVPPILAEHFELKHSLINMMTLDQFFILEKDNPHDHIRWFNKITSTIKYKDVPNSEIKLMLFPFSLAEATRRWLKKNPLVLFSLGKIMFPNSSMNSFLLQERQIFELKFPTFNNVLMNHFIRHETVIKISFVHALIMVLPKCINLPSVEILCVDDYQKQIQGRTQDVLTIIKNKSKCLAADGNTFLEFWDNTQGYVLAATVNYNHGKLKAITTRSGLVLDGPSVPMPPPFINPEEDERGDETLTDPKLADGLVLDGPSVPMPPAFINPEEDERGDETLTDPKLAEYTIKVPPPLTALALIDVHEEEMILHDGDERLTLNIRHDTSSYSNQPHKESINMINIYNDSYEDYLEDLFATNHQSGNPTFSSHTDLTSPEVINPLSGNTTSSSPDHLLEESSDFLPSPEYDSVLYEDFSKVDALPLTNNKDKVFNPGILIHHNLFEVTIRVTPDKNVKKISISNASLILEDFNHPLYELPFHKEVPGF
nr:reverse transcriptase domain-containing protein [Tanacetum cinerariifolium]